jgi:hypothetical protein
MVGSAMSRTQASAKSAGTAHETKIAKYLAAHVDERIERRARNGSKDRGDLSGLRVIGGGRLVAELKDYGGRINAGPWMAEADIEAGNDDAIAAVVIAKRRGTTDPGQQWVLTTVADLVTILTGQRPQEGALEAPKSSAGVRVSRSRRNPLTPPLNITQRG